MSKDTTELKKAATIENLSLIINQKVDEIMKSPLMAHMKGQTDSSKISEILVSTLRAILNDDEEKRLKKVMEKIQKNKTLVEKKEEQLISMKKQFREEYRLITNETAELQKEYQEYSENVKKVESKTSKREEKIKEITRRKEITLEQLLNIVDDSQANHQQLSSEMDDLRKFIEYFQNGTKKMMKQANKMCTDKLQEAYKLCESNKQSVQESIEKSLKEQIAHEKEEQERLRSTMQSILSTIQSLNPDSPQLNVDIDSFEDHTDDIIKYIGNSLEEQQKKARHKILSEIHDAYPDLPMKNDDPNYAVQSLVQKNMKEKEEEYNRLLKRRHEREVQLRTQLKNALDQIKKLQAEVGKSGLDDSLFNDSLNGLNLETGDDDWENTRKELDAKIDELSKFKSESDSSFINFKNKTLV